MKYNLEQFKKISKASEKHFYAIEKVLEKYEINTTLRLSHFLAQILHETGNFRWLEEIWGPTKIQLTYEGRKDLGNNQPGDGRRYSGRGYFQATGRYNYTKYSKILNIDLVNHPELAKEPDIAARIAGEYWKDKGLNSFADKDDIITITKRINGGLIGIDDRKKWLEICKGVLMTKKHFLKEIKDTIHIKDLTSEQIRELQELLKERGHDVGKIDGIYGNNTLYGFNKYKEKHGLTHPGFIGVTTIDHLYNSEYSESEIPTMIIVAPSGGYNLINIDWNNFDSPIGKYFTVGELLRYDKRRIPTTNEVKSNILKMAKELDNIRESWGSPIGITSGYRPADVNAAVGGVKNSQHLNGGAVDIYPIGKNGIAFENWLDKRWDKALGYGQRSGRGFTHIDLRPGRIRWRY